MGRVRTKLVKKAARHIIEKYYPRLTLDFDTNKRVTDEVAVVPTKRVRNKIAGFITHLMKRISRGGSVRGISLKIQEEERERRMDFVPEKSVLDVETIAVDPDTADLLKAIDFGDLSGLGVTVQSAEVQHRYQQRHNQQRGDRDRRPRDRDQQQGGGGGGGGGGQQNRPPQTQTA